MYRLKIVGGGWHDTPYNARAYTIGAKFTHFEDMWGAVVLSYRSDMIEAIQIK